MTILAKLNYKKSVLKEVTIKSIFTFVKERLEDTQGLNLEVKNNFLYFNSLRTN